MRVKTDEVIDLSKKGFALVISGFTPSQYSAPNKAIEFTRAQGFNAGIVITDGKHPTIDVYVDGHKIISEHSVASDKVSESIFYETAIGFSYGKYQEAKVTK